MKKTKKLLIVIAILTLLIIAGIVMYFMFLRPDDTPVIDPQYIGLSGYNKIEYDPSEDTDNDGLTNAEEKELGTNFLNPDTDGDGLLDGDEANRTKTDPLKSDSDEDGLKDGVELLAGLNPNQKMTNGTSLDSEERFTTSYEVDGALLEVKGDANVFTVGMEKVDITGLRNAPGISSDVYELTSQHPFDMATLTIGIKPMLLTELQKNNLTICQVKDDMTFEPVQSEIDTVTWTITASLKHFSRYCVVNMDVINVKATPQVMFVIDNSGSMYPKELCEDSNENDVNFKRLSMVQKMIESHYGEMEFGIAKFTGNYNLMSPMGSSKDDLLKALSDIRTQEEVFNGTALESSLIFALQTFNSKDPNYRKFIVILTDGDSTEGTGGLFSIKVFDEEDIIERARKQCVTIITIGLGNHMKKDFLQQIATNTEGVFINSANSDALDRVYDTIMSALNYNVADLDDDGTQESLLLGECNFNLQTNGFKYKNYVFVDSDGKETDGVCYGISALESLYYTGKLPVKLDKDNEVLARTEDGMKTFHADAYDLTGTFFADKDGNLTNNNLGDYTNSFLDLYNDIYNTDSVNRYVNNDGFLQFNDELRRRIESSPLMKIGTVEQEGKYAGGKYTSFEKCVISIQGVDEGKLSDEQRKDYEVLKALYRLQIDQKDLGLSQKRESIDLSPGILKKDTPENRMDRIIELMQSGNPVIVDGPGHSILGTALYRDLNDANKYTLKVIDPNSPEREKELIITRGNNLSSTDSSERNTEYFYIYSDKDNIFNTGADKVKITIQNIQDVYKNE